MFKTGAGLDDSNFRLRIMTETLAYIRRENFTQLCETSDGDSDSSNSRPSSDVKYATVIFICRLAWLGRVPSVVSAYIGSQSSFSEMKAKNRQYWV